ncbi:WAT1-related protein [Trifolium repens]|nr:WAT1-related protein [Trifolium repens]
MTNAKSDRIVRLKLLFTNAKPYLLMIGLQFGMAGNYIFGKDFLNRGMSRFVFIVYRNAMAAVAVAPFALIFERKKRPKMTLSIFLQIMVLGFLEPVFNQSFTYLGMKYTSASFTSAIMNAVPSITFLLAVIVRLELLKWKDIRSQAKVFGTLVTFGGALVMAIYKGPGFNIFHSGSTTQNQNGTQGSSHNHQTSGALYILMGCVALSSFYILQSVTLKKYPAELSLATLICLTGGAQATAVALVAERHSHAWTIGWDYRLYAPLYTGIVSSGIAYYVQGLVMQMRGPVFATAFNPLCMIIVAGLGSFILGENLYLGSIIGAVIIALGLYTVVWGKAKDYSESDSKLPSEDTKSLPSTSMDDPKIDIISVNMENHPPTNDRLEGLNKLEKESELYVTTEVY